MAFMPMVQAQPLTPAVGLLSVLDYGAVGDGIANDLPAFLSALMAAQSTRALGVYAPVGSYRLSNAAGRVFDLTKAGVTIAGDGIGLTQLLLDDNVTITNHLRLFHLAAPRQTIRDLSIIGGANWAGSFDTSHLEIDNGALYWRAERVECVNVYGYGSAGGVGIGCYQAGAGQQFGHAEDCLVRDSPKACGFGTNSTNNAFVRCQALRCGDRSTRHGFYLQGGASRYEQCYAEASSGYNFHAFKQNQTLDASGDVFDGCVSANPGMQHMVVSGALTRYATITRCAFRGAGLGVAVSVPALISGNVFDGVLASGGAALSLTGAAGGSDVHDNLVLQSGPINTDVAATIHHNTITGIKGINANGNGARVEGNRITASGAGAFGVSVYGTGVSVLNNDIAVSGPGTGLNAYSNAAGLVARGNIITATGGAWYQNVPQTLNAVLENVLR